MKKIIKSKIFLVIMSVVITASISIYATNTYNSNSILYTTNTGESMSVNDALNDLYDNKDVSNFNIINLGSNITSYDLDNISDEINVDLSSLTNENFYFKLSSLYIHSVQAGGHDTYSVTRINSVNMITTYDQTSHIVSITPTSRSIHVDGNYTEVNAYINYVLYLIY